jgi:predicted extracellular nuclease
VVIDNGERVVVIVNHWNSKTGDTPLFGSTQPPVYGSEAQRHKIANVVYEFIEEIKKMIQKKILFQLGILMISNSLKP